MKKYFILAAVAATFAACSFDKDMGESSSQIAQEKIPLTIGTFNGTITAGTTRSASLTLQDAAATKPIGLYILKGAETTTQTDASNYEHFNLTSYTLNNNSPVAGYVGISTASTLYYPDVKTQGISIYAYAPYSASAPSSSDDISSDLLTLQTLTDQKYDAGYLNSDFLWGRQGQVVDATNNIISAEKWQLAKTAAAALTDPTHQILTGTNAAYYGVKGDPSTATVYVPMKHLGSKIIVKVIVDANSGMDITKLKGATVSFYTDKQKQTLNLSTGVLADLTPDAGNTAHTAIAIGKLGYTADDTEVEQSKWDATGATYGVAWTDVNSDSNKEDSEVTAYWCSGVIFPQTISSAATQSLIEIQLNNSTTKYAYSPGATVSFQEAKKYTYTLTVKATTLSVTTSVADWTVESGDGAYTGATDNATLQ